MRSLLIASILTIAALVTLYVWKVFPAMPAETAETKTTVSEAEKTNMTLYSEMKLSGLLTFKAFTEAMAGYQKVNPKKKDILVIIDFTKPSTEERLYVLDINDKKILYHSLVAHGRGSGGNMATSFSNVSGSHKSSLGFYLTDATYEGRNGYSLRLYGLEKDINDKAYERAIVIHGADYCDPGVIRSAGRLGRSYGCPALPREVTDEIINTIKNGSLLYIYADDERYEQQSTILAGAL